MIKYHTFFIFISLFDLVCIATGLQPSYDQQGYSSLLNQYTQSQNVGTHRSTNYCKIPTRELLSTIESTANKVLHGICNPRELNRMFSSLESKLVIEMNMLKAMMANVEGKLSEQDLKIKSQHKKLQREIDSMRNTNNLQEFRQRNSWVRPSMIGDTTYEYYDVNSDSDDEREEYKQSPREPEIVKFNSSVHTSHGKRIFTYYWAVRDMPYRIKNWGWRRSLRSESFYIYKHGYKMYLRIYPNQNGKNIYIHVGITHGDYDEILDWPFKLKHKIQVLDHLQPGEDLSSRLWDPTQLCSGWNWRKPDEDGDNYECVGLGFPHETLSSGHYLFNNAITIKLTVFLD